MSEQIKRVNRELKFKGTIIDFYQDTMEINGDHTVVWDFIKHKGAAAVVPVTEDGKILMVRQYRNALERYTLEIPAGALDEEGEPGFKCAARELEEETGYKSEELEWLITLRTTVAFCNEKIEVYVAKNLITSKQHLDEDEFIDLKAQMGDTSDNIPGGFAVTFLVQFFACPDLFCYLCAAKPGRLPPMRSDAPVTAPAVARPRAGGRFAGVLWNNSTRM